MTPEAMRVNALIRAGEIGEAMKGDGYKLPEPERDLLAELIRDHVDNIGVEPDDDELRGMLQYLIGEDAE